MFTPESSERVVFLTNMIFAFSLTSIQSESLCIDLALKSAFRLLLDGNNVV